MPYLTGIKAERLGTETLLDYVPSMKRCGSSESVEAATPKGNLDEN